MSTQHLAQVRADREEGVQAAAGILEDVADVSPEPRRPAGPADLARDAASLGEKPGDGAG